MTRIQDLGKLYDEAIEVMRDVMNNTKWDNPEANKARAEAAMLVINQYLKETSTERTGSAATS